MAYIVMAYIVTAYGYGLHSYGGYSLAFITAAVICPQEPRPISHKSPLLRSTLNNYTTPWVSNNNTYMVTLLSNILGIITNTLTIITKILAIMTNMQTAGRYRLLLLPLDDLSACRHPLFSSYIRGIFKLYSSMFKIYLRYTQAMFTLQSSYSQAIVKLCLSYI